MRSPLAIAKPVTCPPITPDAIPTEGTRSALVDIVMPDALPAVAPPMVRPVNVMVTKVLAASVIPAVVATIWEAAGVAMGPRGANKAPPDTASVGAKFVAKNLMG